MMKKSKRVNLSIPDDDMERVRNVYERYASEEEDPLSFTGFCTAVILVAVSLVEDGALTISCEPVRPGRPKEVKE